MKNKEFVDEYSGVPEDVSGVAELAKLYCKDTLGLYAAALLDAEREFLQALETEGFEFG